jgi:hypothetical protein
MTPDTLRQVYDNELRTSADDDALTLPELLDTISDSIWNELDEKPTEKATARKRWISSLRANLQREHLKRLIDLNLSESSFSAAYRPISNLALVRLRHIQDKVAESLEQKAMLDPYSLAHLEQVKMRIEKALDAQYILNANNNNRRSGGIIIRLGQDE